MTIHTTTCTSMKGYDADAMQNQLFAMMDLTAARNAGRCLNISLQTERIKQPTFSSSAHLPAPPSHVRADCLDPHAENRCAKSSVLMLCARGRGGGGWGGDLCPLFKQTSRA